MASTSIHNAMSETLGLDKTYGGAQRKFPYMPVGEATDMGFDENGIPSLIHEFLTAVNLGGTPIPTTRS